jgi:ribosomal protein L14E/L6E/L27E
MPGGFPPSRHLRLHLGAPAAASALAAVGSLPPLQLAHRPLTRVCLPLPRLQTFIKLVNYQHIMPTRYTLEVELKGVVTPDCVDNSTKKVEANKEVKALLEDKFKSGKNRWFFTKLRF